MALDRWFPTRFATFNDRLVTQNGVLLVGIAAGVMMLSRRFGTRARRHVFD